MTAVEVPDRPPDRIIRDIWEPYSRGTKTVTRVVGGSLLRGFTTETVEVEIVGWRRKRMEVWIIPERRWAEPQTVDGVLTLTLRHEPERTIGRWEWEYQR